MAQRHFTPVVAFLLGVGFMLPFTLAFRAPAAAEPTITLQNLAERLSNTEKILATVRSTATLGDSVVAMGSQLNTLQSHVNSIDKRIHEQDDLNAAAFNLNAAAVKTLQDDARNAKGAIALLNLAANINAKNGGATLQQVATDLAALKTAYNTHYHKITTQNVLSYYTFDCASKNNFTGVCAEAGLKQFVVPGPVSTDVTVKPAP